MDGGWQEPGGWRELIRGSPVADSDLPDPGSMAEGHREPEGTGAATSASLPWPLLLG